MLEGQLRWGGRWAGRTALLCLPGRPKATVLLWAPQPEVAWEAMWPIGVQELQAHCRVPVGPVHIHECPPICTQDLRELCESGSC